MRLIVTRPEPEASRTARALIRLGHEAILSPVLDIVLDLDAAIPERAYQAALATSSNAVRALAGRPKWPIPSDAPLFAVGDQTALEAKRAGLSAARSAGGTLDDLIALAAAELSPEAGPLLYVAGEARSGDLAARLRERGFDIVTAVVYRAEALKRLANVAEAALKDGSADGVLLYSERSAAAFALALRAGRLAPLGARVACFCLSEAAAAAVSGATRGKVLVAARPDQIALFALVEGEAAARAAALPGD